MKPFVALVACLLLLAPAFTHGGEIRRDVVYGHAPDGTPLRLDAHVPSGGGLHPVAILVHGGGWTAGDKAGSDKPGNGADITPWFAPLTAADFTWFSINYRLAPKYRWPACFDDVRTAILWVKAHAREFGGDPHRVALIGHSAGGQLVCLAGTLADESTRVQAVVGFAPVTDLEADTARRHGLSTSLQQLFGTAQPDPTPAIRALLHEASPIAHVRPGLAPFLLVHGDADKTVPYEQSLAFQARLRASGDRCDLITVPGAPHGLLKWTQFAPDYATRMIAWLRQTLDEPVQAGQR